MLELGGQALTLKEIAEIALAKVRLELAPAAIARMEDSRRVVRRVAEEDAPVYGINTGFGKLCEVRIADDAIDRLQLNLVRSHACGLGRPLSEEETRVVMALRANTLALGLSGVRPRIAEMLCAFLNHGVHPVVPQRGSVGASGDLAPLAHVALALVGEGEVFLEDRRLPAAIALKSLGMKPLVLEAKEGLSLVNGTQAMLSVGLLALRDAEILADTADVAGALSLDGLRGSTRAFDPRLHKARPHPGQMISARNLTRLNRGSAINKSHQGCSRVPRSSP